MKQTAKRLAILTDYLLHPQNDDFLAVVENQTLLKLISFLKRELDWSVDVFQISPLKERRFGDLTIFGIDAKADNYGMYSGLNTTFARFGLDYDLCIYYHWHLAYPLVCHRSIVVSHGVFWDSAATFFNRFNSPERDEWRKRLLYGVSAPLAFIAQDRSTANVIKATWPGYDQKLVYLPPGIDLEEFKPLETKEASETIRVLCPQDFTYEQGINEVLTLCEINQIQEPAFQFHIVGQMKQFSDAVYLADRVRALSNCRFYWKPLARLAELYREFDMVLLPSRATEGASVYCLQAMASGLPVVAGLAGGLSEMVVDGWNGYLVQPELKNYQEAIKQLARNKDLRLRMSQNSRSLAEGYPDSVWKDRWKKLLDQIMGPTIKRGG